MSELTVLRALRGIDWDFAVPRAGYVPPPHWYPATFIPALSDALIESLIPPSGIVFDPYGGIGTTGWSAIRTGRISYLADVNPVALLVAYGTNSLLSIAIFDQRRSDLALALLERASTMSTDLFGVEGDAQAAYDLDHLVALRCKPSPLSILRQVIPGPPNWSALEPWIARPTLAHLQAIVARLDCCRSRYIQLLGLCMISATIRSLSSQHASWGHIADNVRPRELKNKDVHIAVARWLKRSRSFFRAATGVEQRGSDPSTLSTIFHRDWSKPPIPGPRDADLLLTSPPYADAIDYTLAQRLSLYLLGYDDQAILSLVSGEIGARRKRFKSGSRSDWSRQLCDALPGQVAWLKPDSAICLILPHKDSGRSAGEDDLKGALEQLGWRLFFERDRSIHQSHTRQSWTSIKKETILVFTSSDHTRRRKGLAGGPMEEKALV